MTTTSNPPQQSPSPGAPLLPPVRAGAGRAAAAWAMFQKEARELLLVTGLVAAAYGAVLAALLMQTTNGFQQGGPPDSTALSRVFLAMGTSFIAPAAALLFGFAQFFREIRPDRFALLTHRPVPRGFLFACKAVTGLFLYAVALVVPLVIALGWASNPHNIPLPFAWSMGLAPLSDILAGVPYYFAGVLVAQRLDARWVGSRLLPAAAALSLSVITIVSPSFWTAATVALVAAAGVAVAAESYYAASGQYARVRGLARPFNGMVLLAALVTVGLMGFALVEALFDDHQGYYTVSSRTTPEILEDGTPVVEEAIYPTGKTRILDLSGRELGVPWQQGRQGTPNALRLLNFGPLFSTHDFQTRRSLHEPDAYFVDSRQLYSLHAAWYAAGGKTGNDYLVGYHSNPGTLVGAIGAHGFEPGAAVPRARFARPMLVLGNILGSYNGTYFYEVGTQFDGPSTMNLISAGDTLYQLRADGTLDAILTTPTHAPIVSLGIAPSAEENAAGSNVVTSYPMLTTDREAIILSPMTPGKKPATLAHFERAGLEKYAVMGARIVKTGQFVLRVAPYADLADSAAPEHVVYFKPEGGVDHEVVLPALRVEWSRVDSGNVLENYVGPVIAPPAGLLVLRTLGMMFDSQGRDWTVFWRAFRLSLIGGAVTGLLTFFLCHRRKMGGVWLLWTVVALLAGPAGLVLLFCLRGLPVTVPCAVCGKRRRIDQAVCSSCGAAIRGPAANGTEIFAVVMTRH